MMHDPDFASDLDALLEAGKVVPTLPDVVRARSLARARAVVATTDSSPFRPLPAVRRRGLAFALAASAAVAIAGASALAAFGLRSRPAIQSEPVPAPATRAPARPHLAAAPEPAPVPTPTPTVLPKATPAHRPQRPAHPAAVQESYAAEIALLQRAQVAYAAGHFVDALVLLAEHGRKFPGGRLAEEREALRVRSLSGAGRADEAERAAAAFVARFPRSVLLPHPRRDPR